jgi:hypothetical protein
MKKTREDPFVVIVDMRASNGRVCAIVEDGNGDHQWMKLFKNEAAARRLMKNHPLGAFPYQVVRVHLLH